MTFPRDLLIFLPYLSLTREWNKTWEAGWEQEKEKNTVTNEKCSYDYGFDKGCSFSKYLFKGQLSGQLFAQHHHPCHPKEDEVTTSLQDRVGVKVLEVSRLSE